MPGLYLACILVSAAGIAVIDARLRLAAWAAPGRTAITVAAGVVFFLAWDVVGITTESFLKGDSPYFIGIDIAPHLPLEEIFFLSFLCYLALVLWAGAMRVLQRRAQQRMTPVERSEPR